MRVGDVVVSKNPEGNPLRSGASVYSSAIVASLDPFVLVSPRGDMKWSTTRTPDDVVVTGQKATLEMLEHAARRLRD